MNGCKLQRQATQKYVAARRLVLQTGSFEGVLDEGLLRQVVLAKSCSVVAGPKLRQATGHRMYMFK